MATEWENNPVSYFGLSVENCIPFLYDHEGTFVKISIEQRFAKISINSAGYFRL